MLSDNYTAQAYKGFRPDFFENDELAAENEMLRAENARLKDDNANLRDEHEYDQELLWRQRLAITTVTDVRAWVLIRYILQMKPDHVFGTVVLDSAQCVEILQNYPGDLISLKGAGDANKQAVRAMQRVPVLMPIVRCEPTVHGKKVWRLIRDD